MKKRKKFDAKKKRIIDEEHKSLLENNNKNNKNKINEEKSKNSKQNWKMKSEMFRQAMKGANYGNDSKSNVILVDKNFGNNENTKNISNSNNLQSNNNLQIKNNSQNSNINFNPINQVSENTYSDLNPCNFCGRKFNQTAYEKHVVICEKKYHLNNIKNNSKPVKKK